MPPYVQAIKGYGESMANYFLYPHFKDAEMPTLCTQASSLIHAQARSLTHRLVVLFYSPRNSLA